MSEKINMHSLILMHYSITLTNGSIIESSFEGEPVEITMGHGNITEGMELALFGLKEGDEQTLTLTPDQGFGVRNNDDIHHIPLSDFPNELPPEAGMSYSFESSEGEEIPGTVIAVTETTAEVDFNHPLAGQDIVFTVKILGIDNAHTDID